MPPIRCEESEKKRRDPGNTAFSNTGFVYDEDLTSDKHNKELQLESISTQEKHSQEVLTTENVNASKGIRLLAKLRRQAWLLPLIHTHFWASAAFTLMQPFYPSLAASAGLEAWKYGFVFSTYKVAMLLGSILTERIMVVASPFKAYVAGQLGFFCFNIAFGSLYWSPGGDILLALSILVAVLGGILQIMYLIATYSVVTNRFPRNTGLIIALMEAVWGFGNMLGSGTGGALIDAWAYPLPFFVMGSIMILSLPAVIKIRHIYNADSNPSPEKPVVRADQADMKLYRLLWDPLFLIDAVTLMLSWVVMGFNEPTLEPHLGQFKMTSTQVGVVFMVQFVSYAIGALVAGAFCHCQMETFYAFVGQSATVFTYLIIGPAPFIAGPAKLWMIYLSQVLTGVGMSAQFICAYCHALKYAAERGYPSNLRTSGFVSAVVFTFLFFGATVTPPIAGYLVQAFGYRTGSMFLFGLLLLWTPVTFFHWIRTLRCGR